MKKQNTFIFWVITLVLVSCHSIKSSSINQEIWSKRLDKIELLNVPVTRAVETLVAAYKTQYPDDQRLSGYVVANGEMSVSTVTVELANIPLGEACHLIAEAAGLRYALHERSLCFFPSGSGYYTDSTQVLSLSFKVQHSLGLEGHFELANVIERLRSLKVRTAAFTKTQLFESDGNNYLIVSGDREEIDTLHYLWKLLERGLKTGSGSAP